MAKKDTTINFFKDATVVNYVYKAIRKYFYPNVYKFQIDINALDVVCLLPHLSVNYFLGS